MGRRKRKRTKGQVAATGVPSTRTGDIITDLSHFSAANPSMRRGWVYMPESDTRRDLDRYTREEMMLKSRWCQDNIGLAGAAVDGLAELVGFWKPLSNTEDEAWNVEADRYFFDRMSNPDLFDRAGKMDFYDWQIEQTRSDLGDGDSATVLTENGQRGAQIAFYESHQIASKRGAPLISKGESRFQEIDGVIINKKTGRASHYLLIDDPSSKSPGQAIAAKDVIFSANYTRHSRVRGVTALRRAINHILDRTEIEADLKATSKATSQVAWYLTGSRGNNAFTQHPMAGASRTLEIEEDGTVMEEGKGSGKAQKVKLEDVIGSTYALNLEDQKLQMAHDSRPHPNQIDFLNHLVRDISWGVGVAPEVLWMLAGLTGPEMRFVLARLDRWIKERLRKRLRSVRRFRTYFWAKEFKRGYPMPKDPQWWKAEYVPQADLTIDHGRDGALELKRFERGLDTLPDIYARRGKDADVALRQRGETIKKAEDIAEVVLGDRLRWRDILPPSTGAPGEVWLPDREQGKD